MHLACGNLGLPLGYERGGGLRISADGAKKGIGEDRGFT